MNAELLKAEIRIKLTMRIYPNYREDDWYARWTKTIDYTADGIMDVLGKYDIKEKV